MTLPNFQLITVELLKSLKDKKIHDISDSVVFLADFFELTEEDRIKLKRNGRETFFHNRVHEAKYYLKRSGLLENPSKGKINISDSGLVLLDKNIEKMDRVFLTELSIELRSFRN
jgi:restriction system protein